MDDAVNVDPEMFKDFSRGYAYGYGYGYSHQIDGTAGKITRMTAKDYEGSPLGSSGNNNCTYFIGGWNGVARYPGVPVWEFEYGSGGTAGSVMERTKTQDVVKFEYYTIPFDEYIKVQSSVNYTNIMIYSC